MKDFLNYLEYELFRSKHTVEAYRRDLSQFVDFLKLPAGDFDPAAVTSADIRAWLSALGKAGEAPASLRRKTQSLRAYFKYLCRRKVITLNPAEEIILAKLPKPLPDFIKDSDIKKLLGDATEKASVTAGIATEHRDASTATVSNRDAASAPCRTMADVIAARDHLILHILYAAGLRRAELLSLTDENVHLAARRMKILGKGRKERIVPIAGELAAEIARWQTIRDQAFPDLSAPRPIIATRFGAMSASNLELTIKRLLKDENAGRKSPHTLRHSFATAMLNGGADLNSVRAILGHASLTTTQIYTHLQFSDIRKAYGAHPRSANNSEHEKGESIEDSED